MYLCGGQRDGLLEKCIKGYAVSDPWDDIVFRRGLSTEKNGTEIQTVCSAETDRKERGWLQRLCRRKKAEE